MPSDEMVVAYRTVGVYRQECAWVDNPAWLRDEWQRGEGERLRGVVNDMIDDVLSNATDEECIARAGHHQNRWGMTQEGAVRILHRHDVRMNDDNSLTLESLRVRPEHISPEQWRNMRIGEWEHAHPASEIIVNLHGDYYARNTQVRMLGRLLGEQSVTVQAETRDWTQIRIESTTPQLQQPHLLLNYAFMDRFRVPPNLESPPPRWERNRGLLRCFECDELGLTLEIVSVNGENRLAVAPPDSYYDANWARFIETGDNRLAETARRVNEESKRTQEAEERANQLIKDVIGDVAYKSLSKRGYIEVQSPNELTRYYHVPRNIDKRVVLYEGGHFKASLCIDAVDSIPAGDRVLLHKLMIEGSEREYLEIANWFSKNGVEMDNPYREKLVTVTATITDDALADAIASGQPVAIRDDYQEPRPRVQIDYREPIQPRLNVSVSAANVEQLVQQSRIFPRFHLTPDRDSPAIRMSARVNLAHVPANHVRTIELENGSTIAQATDYCEAREVTAAVLCNPDGTMRVLDVRES